MNIILLAIFLVPLSSAIPIPGTCVWYPQLLALMCLGFFLSASVIWKMNKFISLFLVYTTLSYLLVCGQSPRSMLCLIVGYSGILFSYFVSKQEPKKIYTAIRWLAFINLALFTLQVFNIDPIFKTSTNDLIDRTVGFMGSRNQLGIFSASSLLSITTFCPYLILISLVPIFIIKCWSALAGILIGGISYFFLNNKNLLAWFLVSILLVAMPLAIHSKYGDLGERFTVWKQTIKQSIKGLVRVYPKNSDKGFIEDTTIYRDISSNPLFGFGIGNFFVYSPASQVGFTFSRYHRYEHAHNDLIEALFEFGYIGMALIVACIFKVFADFFNALHYGHPNTKGLILSFCSLLTISVCSMGIYVFHAPVSFFLFCLFLGLFYREVDNAKQSKCIKNPS